MYSGPLRIYDRNGYTLDSYGNGAAYCLTRKSDGASCWLQDQDATTFREGLDRAYAFSDIHVLAVFTDYEPVMQKAG